MADSYPQLRVAAIQAAPVFGDPMATIDKMDRLIEDASGQGAEFVAFGESFLAGYPIWALVNKPVDLHPYFEEFFLHGIEVPGEECARLAALAAKHNVGLSVGINEKSRVSQGTMWNANLIFSPTGQLVNHRRKLVNTFVERLLFAPGDGHDLAPVPIGSGDARLGALICGENTNTLARFALLAQGEQVHVATYPPCGVFERRAENFDMGDAIRIRAAAHSFEGKVFTIAVATMPDPLALEYSAGGDPDAVDLLKAVPPSASMIIGPRGDVVAGPLVAEEGILVADLDLRQAIAPKLMHDIVGAYNRFDIFNLTVLQARREPISLTGSRRASEDEMADPVAIDGAAEERPLSVTRGA